MKVIMIGFIMMSALWGIFGIYLSNIAIGQCVLSVCNESEVTESICSMPLRSDVKGSNVQVQSGECTYCQ